MNLDSRRPYSIRRRVALLVGFGALAPMLVALWALHSASDEVSVHLLEEHRILARSLALHFNHDMREAQSSLLAAIGTPEDWEGGHVQQALHATLLHSPILDAIAVVGKDQDGTKKVLWKEMRHGTLDAGALLAVPEIAAAFASGRQGVAPLVEPQLHRFVFLVPVRDWDGQVSKLVAAIANPASPTWLAVLHQGGLGGGSASLVDDKARVVVSFGPATAVPARDDDIVATGELAVVPWRLVLRQPRAEALAPLEAQRTRLFILAPLLLVFAVLFSWGATHSVTEPLKALGDRKSVV